MKNVLNIIIHLVISGNVEKTILVPDLNFNQKNFDSTVIQNWILTQSHSNLIATMAVYLEIMDITCIYKLCIYQSILFNLRYLVDLKQGLFHSLNGCAKIHSEFIKKIFEKKNTVYRMFMTAVLS